MSQDASSVPAPRHGRIWLHFFGGTVVALLLFAVSLYFAVDWHGRALWKQHLADLEEAGRTLDPGRLFSPAHEGTFWGDPFVRAMGESEDFDLGRKLKEALAKDPDLDEKAYASASKGRNTRSINGPDWFPDWATGVTDQINLLIWEGLPSGGFLAAKVEQQRWAFGPLLESEATLADRIESHQAILSENESGWFRNPAIEFFFGSATSFGSILARHHEIRALLEMARAAIAAERCRLATGHLPANWEELVPQWFDSIPKDPWSRGPLIYRLEGEGRPVIYSVGRNGLDEGGRYSESRNEGDLVWRYSEAEPSP